MTGPAGRAVWRISRSDLASGGRTLLWLWHPLLPDFESALPSDDGLVLGPAVRAPEALPGAPADEAGAYFVRLLGLLAFLRWAGLGVAPGDAARIGRRKDGRPALGAAPVPGWRALSPAHALAAAALGAAGAPAPEGAPLEELGRSAAGLPAEPYRRIAGAAVRSAERGERPETLLAKLARDLESFPGGADFLGLLYPPCSGGDAAGRSRPAWAAGRAGLFVARGALRRRGDAPFVEAGPGGSLEDGAALRKALAVLGPARCGRLRTLLEGGRPVATPEGPEVAILGRDPERWDRASRTAFDALTAADGFLRFEARESPPAPWEDREAIVAPLGLAEVSSILYLPFEQLSSQIAAWEETARLARGDAGRFLLLAGIAASRFRPTEARSGLAAPSRGRPAPAGGKVLDAASLLADGFDAAEAAVAAGVPEALAATQLDEAVAAGGLVEEAGGRYRFAEPAARRRRAAGLSRAGRRDVVGRLAAAGIDGARLAVAGLSRGDEADLREASRRFAEAIRDRDPAAGLALLGRAPAGAPDLGDPVGAAEVLFGARAYDEARDAAGRADAAALESVPAERKGRVARLMARLGHVPKALALAAGVPAGDGLLLRARVLLDARLDREAAALLASGVNDGPGRDSRFDLRLSLLEAESASRARDFAAARKGLDAALGLIDEGDDPEAAYEASLTAGWLAADLGNPAEAAAFFRRARDIAPDEARRADARVDLQVALYDQGRLDEASNEIGEALAFFAASGDQGRYLSALGNRADVRLRSGDFRGARADLDRLLPWDRDRERSLQFLFTASSVQHLALLEGDADLAARTFDEARERMESHPRHDAAREILVLEGARRLATGDPAGAIAVLEEAGSHAEGRVRNEELRTRLLRSAATDAGRAPGAGDLPREGDERWLLEAERRLLGGEAPGRDVLKVLARWSRSPRGAGEAAGRILEWAGRFPAFFRASAARGLLEAGKDAAVRAGLDGAEERISALLAALAPADRPERTGPPGAPDPSRPAEVVAEDAGTREVFATAARVARTSLPVLVLGETGTGKEVVAREIHRLSRRKGPFVAVNVAAVPDTLAEAELFGHARGAFTGADRERRGLIEASSGGTLFLDEVGELPMSVQAKLLRVLQERSVRRLGETAERPVDLRVVSATHRDLPARIAAGLFRQDLYFRLAGAELSLAPLRERPRDLAALVDRLLSGGATLSAEARRIVLSDRWPGNVRELASALESAGALAAPGKPIGPGDLPKPVRARGAAVPAPGGRGRYREAVEAARREVILAALAENGGNRTRAAAALGLSRQSLLYEMKKLGLD